MPGGNATPWWWRIADGVCKWFCALSAPEKWAVGILAALATVVAIFGFCNLTAEWVGYKMAMGDALTPGLRFFRDTVLALAAIIGIWAALWRTAAFDRQTRVSENRLLNERFATAAELMAKENNDGKPAISARINGIYIMERLAKSASKEFAEQVVKNLVAYIKGHAQLTARRLRGEDSPSQRMLGEDVKAAFAVLDSILSNKATTDEIRNCENILDFSRLDLSSLLLDSSQVNLSHYKNWAMADFAHSELFEANLKNADLWYAIFNGAGLSSAQLGGAKLQSVMFNGARMKDANMTEAHFLFTNMEGTNLRNADLRGAMLDKTSLSRTDLSGAKMQGTTLSHIHGYASTCLNYALLDGAKLSQESKLCNVPMRGVSLRGVMILDADLRGADLSEVQFGETYISATTLFAPGDLSEQIKSAMDGKIWHSGAAWAQGIKERPDNAEWDLTQYEDGYALAGILENFAKENNPKFNSINLRQQARKLLDNGNLPKDTPQKWRKWLAEIDPATGLTLTKQK